MFSSLIAPKPIVVCADDYALNDSVSQGIVELARHQRLSATSVMSLSPLWEHHAPALRELKDAIDVGLHLDWTSEFARKVGWGQGLPAMMWHSLRGGLDATRVREAIERLWSRPVTPAELALAHSALGASPDADDWHDYAHSLFLAQETVYLP